MVEVQQVENQVEHVYKIHSASHGVVKQVGNDYSDRNVQQEVQNLVCQVVKLGEC